MDQPPIRTLADDLADSVTDEARWEPGSPAWVTHQAMLTENCQLRNERDGLRAALTALVEDMRTLADDKIPSNLWANRLAAILAPHQTLCPDCDHGIAGGQPCATCGGSGGYAR